MGTKEGYTPFDALNAAKKGYLPSLEQMQQESVMDQSAQNTQSELLKYVQDKISSTREFSSILYRALENREADRQLKDLIFKLLARHMPPVDDLEEMTNNIYEDMAGLGFLRQFLNDPRVEEINIYGPGPNKVEIIYDTHAEMLPYGFVDAQAVIDLVKKMVRMGGMTLDLSTPRVDSYMESGTRISAMIAPVIREDQGAVASIRKQTKSYISRRKLLEGRTAMEEELDFIETCVKYHVSGAIVGATGSGKTTLLNYLISEYVNTVKDEQTRVYIIEESRELQLPGDARAIYTAVVGEPNPVTAPDLTKSALRFHPTFICCAEMRGEEAMNAQTAAQTGHTVWSSFHADNCEDAYSRLLTMCKMSGTDLSEDLLMRNIVSAFPIIVSSQQMKDGSRKITGVYEATGVENARVQGHYIYKMRVSKIEYDSEGRVVHVYGWHCRVGDVSDKMAQRIYDTCGNEAHVRRFARNGWSPQNVTVGSETIKNHEQF